MQNKSDIILGVTGHRPSKLGHDYNYAGDTSRWIARMCLYELERLQPKEAWTGLALGTDMIFALKALQANVPLAACLPMVGQHMQWPERSRDIYELILKQATKIVICDLGNKIVTFEEFAELPPTPYHPYKMQARNKYLVDNINVLLAFWNGSEGGTANCLEYASKQLIEIREYNPNTLKAVKRSKII